MKSKSPVERYAAGTFDGDDMPKIKYLEGRYELYDSTGLRVATCGSPKPLATLAFDSGAGLVHHDYDLRAAESY